MTPVNVLAPGSEEWFAFWGDKIDRLIAGEEPARIGRIPLEAIDLMRALPRGPATCGWRIIGGTAKGGIARMISRKLTKRLEQLEARRMPAPAVEGQSAVHLIVSRLAAWGVEREPNESLAETTARAMGISTGELRARLWLLAGRFVATDIRP